MNASLVGISTVRKKETLSQALNPGLPSMTFPTIGFVLIVAWGKKNSKRSTEGAITHINVGLF
jgi:hypothetical protein